VSFRGKKIFITGASRGIGQAIAKVFREENAYVIGTRTKPVKDSDNICNEWFSADFSEIVEIQKCVDFLRCREPDVLINNAGINRNAPFTEIDLDVFLNIQQVNLLAPFLLSQAAVPNMLKRSWGRIVNISSIWGKISMSHRASYSASKFALDGITIALAAEHTKDGILSNSISPGFIDTDLTRRMLGDSGIEALVSKVPAGRLGKVEEIARLVLWLSSEGNTFISGQNISIDGGFTRV